MKLENCKVFVVGGDTSYFKWLSETEKKGEETKTELVDTIEEADLVVFTGGADVDPTLYSEKTGSRTVANKSRDKKEVQAFNKAKKLGKKLLGICRGSQFLTVMAGGQLIQHVSGHALSTSHMINTYLGARVYITSTHHQMMYPYNLDDKDYILLAWSHEQYSDTYLDGNDEEKMLVKTFREPEIVLYKNIDAFAIQGHPERMSQDSLGVKEIKKMINTFLNIKKYKNDKEEKKSL